MLDQQHGGVQSPDDLTEPGGLGGVQAGGGLVQQQEPRTVREGAPHSFCDRSFKEWEDICQDAWRRILSFTE
ncbi:hypothetical protein ACWCSD_49300, partial [Nonomuraea sp. NPDC001684]